MANIKKKCPICGREIRKQGWNMHMGNCSEKNDKPYVKWSEVEGGAQASGDKQPFRGEGSGESRGEGSGEKEFWKETFDE